MTADRIVDWIAVDWGTSRMRAWAMAADGRPAAAPRSGPGMSALAGQGAPAFEAALLEVAAGWLDGREAPLPVLVCGMAGARQGWREAPYLDLPLPLARLGEGTLPVETADPRLAVSLVPGLAQRDPAAPDVLRGEETQILGFLAGHEAARSRSDWVLCLPGTHAKWVSVGGGTIRTFRTYMTGEIFALFAGHSILRHSLEGEGSPDPEAFPAAVREAIRAPADIAAALFGLRARHLLFGEAGANVRARLSGLLIGQEIASAAAWPGGPSPNAGIAVIGDDSLAALYAEGLRIAGVAPETVSGEAAVLDGLAVLQAIRQGRATCAN